MAMDGPASLRLGIYLIGLVFFLILELIHPYRQSTRGKAGRWTVNLILTGFNSVLMILITAGAMAALFIHVSKSGAGILNAIGWPLWARIAVTVAVLDFITYVWHLLNHVVPLLWRFHRVHHSDLDMDVSTANRFHLGELLLSMVLRMALIYLLGAEPLGVLVFEIGLTMSTQFHHSSLKIPEWLDRAWLVLFVPPSLHRVHHSVIIKERDSNYGVIFSLWDRMMGTLRTDVDQAGITIGVGAYRDPKKLGLMPLLIQPFTKPIR